ncbi:MAG: LPS assembly protein LptD [Campylobacterota bacterium]|nr:LPS assembly protein LptD [Campylobacterota bacterium]
MFRTLFFLLFFSFALFGADKVEIYASSLDSIGDNVEASGGVSVMYKEYFLTAQRATYNRKNGDLELYDNIRLNHKQSYKVLGNYAKINIAKKERLFRPFFMSEKASQVWLSAQEGQIQNNLINVDSGVLSGCNPVDPLWKMEFSSSDYNTSTKWMNLYNARLYIEDIPVFYTPYFGYSLDTTRRTGLLMPVAGYSSNEGIFYEQPIYIAEQNWWDLELRPQIRTFRGQGIYQTLRFIDSKSSKGEISAGYFKEFDEYFYDSELQNNSHYGYTINYENWNLVNNWLGTDFDGQSGLYLDINSLNDVDYINLSSNDTHNNSTATQVLSRVNLFYNMQNHYFGSYLKYYQDLTLVSNDETLQKLPTLQYHHYLDTLFEDHLLYSMDIQSNNITRTKNKTAIQTDMDIPLLLRTSLFDEYLNLSYRANLSMQHSKFGGSEEDVVEAAHYNDGYILRNYHTLGISTDLTKGYEGFSHVISFGASYNMVGSESRKGYYQDNAIFCSQEENSNEPQCDFYNVSGIDNETEIGFTQYVYGKDSKEVLYHRLAQKISHSEISNQFGELENELDYKVTEYLSFYNNMFFNYDKSLFSKVFNQLSINRHGVSLGLSHLYKDTFLDSTSELERYTSYLTSSLSYTYDKHYSYSALYNYDSISKEAKSMEVGFMYKKRCWDFGLRYSENNRPILTTTGESSIYEKYIYLTVVLKPLMRSDDSSMITYQLPNDN